MWVEEINPYDSQSSKSEQVEEMFDSIAPAYDFMNTAMTMGLHRVWRNRALKEALKNLPSTTTLQILDVATGTGDIAFKLHSLLPDAKITGIDLSQGMLKIAQKKLEKLPYEKRGDINFEKGDSLSLPFEDSRFDLITVGYGVRNFSRLPLGLAEMRRVVRPGGVLCIIELSCPTGKITSPLYRLYSRKIIPAIGRMVSGDSRAYSYLPESIAACPQRQEMASLLKDAGFNNTLWKSLTFGVVTYYIAR